MMRAFALLAILLAAPAALAQDLTLVETPTLSRTHDALPPVAERVPAEPLVVDLAAKGRTEGVHGGDLDTIIGRTRDARLINVWGYARLVGYDEDFTLVPDILHDVEEEEGRVFTLHLREGHRWSDGTPFTAEDFRYYFEDIATNTELTPTPPPFLVAGDSLPTFEVVDETTVRYSWDVPNPRFLPTLAQARPPFIYRPAHYLKQFNPKYGDEAEIARLVEAARVRSWAPLHNLRDEMYDATNPELPSLQPWVPSGQGTDRRTVMVRNPYFHRVTSEGRQLPFIDRVVMSVADGSLIATKVQAGEADLQARGLSFGDLPVLKAGEDSRGYTVRLWPEATSSAIAIYPNLTVSDPVLRELFRDRRFREALSLATDRTLLNEVLFYGLGTPSANVVLAESPLHEASAMAAPELDTDRANALLDEIGLVERNREGLRLLPDGRPLELIVRETLARGSIKTIRTPSSLVKGRGAQVRGRPFSAPPRAGRPSRRTAAFSVRAYSRSVAVWSGYATLFPRRNPAARVRVLRVSTDASSRDRPGLHTVMGWRCGVDAGEKHGLFPARRS